MSTIGKEAGKLTAGQARYLRSLLKEDRAYEIANSALAAMVRRGLVRSHELIGTKRVYSITDAGRLALSRAKGEA